MVNDMARMIVSRFINNFPNGATVIATVFADDNTPAAIAGQPAPARVIANPAQLTVHIEGPGGAQAPGIDLAAANVVNVKAL